MRVLIVGLGLIGGSYAMALSKNGHIVYGVDINKDSIDFALDKKWIIDGSNNPEDFIRKSDLIIICLYPQLILD